MDASQDDPPVLWPLWAGCAECTGLNSSGRETGDCGVDLCYAGASRQGWPRYLHVMWDLLCSYPLCSSRNCYVCTSVFAKKNLSVTSNLCLSWNIFLAGNWNWMSMMNFRPFYSFLPTGLLTCFWSSCTRCILKPTTCTVDILELHNSC